MKNSLRMVLVAAITVAVTVPVVAIASERFTDVPDTNIFHDDISWLADTGVTKGCNPPDNDEFCPKEAVTREQMAAFMRRFADYLETQGTASNADTLDGLHAGELSRAEGAHQIFLFDTTDQLIEVDFFEIDIPVAGSLITNLALNCESKQGTIDTRWDVDVTIDGQQVTGEGIALYFNHSEIAGRVFASGSAAYVTPITAGTHDIGFRAQRSETGNGSLDCDVNETAVFLATG